MQEDLDGIIQRMMDIMDDFKRITIRRFDKSARSFTDPMVKSMLNGMGIDFSQLLGMASGQAAVDLYKIMGLDRSASDEEVKKRYRELVYILHPDKSGTPGTAAFFQMVNTAYELIKRERKLE
jgi:DnaJ-domain-containing protein 1